jgi:catechol 1,2-dioxygenase
VVFGVTRELVGDYTRHDDGRAPAPDVSAPWYTLDFRLTLQPGEAKLPRPPIR